MDFSQSDTDCIIHTEQINTTHSTVLHPYSPNLINKQVQYTVTYEYEQCSGSQQTIARGKKV